MKLSFAAVRSVLECGPMTMQEVARFFPGHPYRNVSSIISKMNRRTVTKTIYIQSWTREGIGRTYLRAVYALGDRRDAQKPPLISNAERLRTSRARRKLPRVPNSVFQLSEFQI